MRILLFGAAASADVNAAVAEVTVVVAFATRSRTRRFACTAHDCTALQLEPAARVTVVPGASCKAVPDPTRSGALITYVPGGTVTVPPPALRAAVSAAWMAAVESAAPEGSAPPA